MKRSLGAGRVPRCRRNAAVPHAGASRAPEQARAGFTLIELLIVTCVLAILAMIAVHPLQKARERAMLSAAQAQLRNTLGAAERYHVIHGRFPSDLEQLEETGYAASRSVSVCAFEILPSPAGGSDLNIQVVHRGAEQVVSTMASLGAPAMRTIPLESAAPGCRDAASAG